MRATPAFAWKGVQHDSKFGEKVSVPGPMDIELDTEILENHVR